MSEPTAEEFNRVHGGKPFFKTRKDEERFRLIFGLELAIGLNTRPRRGRLTPWIVSELEFMMRHYPDYILPNDFAQKLRPFLEGPYKIG
jgi:hypothetical protein